MMYRDYTYINYIDDIATSADFPNRSEPLIKHDWINTKEIQYIGASSKRVVVLRCSKCSMEAYRGRDAITVLNEDRLLSCEEYMVKDIIV